jgi:inosine-uridine nucleoside N-ribohydrolase
MTITKTMIMSLFMLMVSVFNCSAQSLSFDVPAKKQVRILISADAKNEADDDFAIVHALLTPSFDVKGLLGSQFSRTAPLMSRDASKTATESVEEIQRVLKFMPTQVPVFTGAQQSLQDVTDLKVSDAAQAIIDEAHRDSKTPLYILVLGPMTDVALAYRKDPTIAEHMTVIWIGGMPYPKGGWEYNLFNDPAAAQIVFDSTIPLWQIPHDVYMTMRVSFAELELKVKPQGDLGKYLWNQMIEFNNFANKTFEFTTWPKSEVWVLGDNPSISLLLATELYQFTEQASPIMDKDLNYLPNQNSKRNVRVYHNADSRFTLEDLFSKLAIFNRD